MRRAKIVPLSPTGFPREQDLMFPFPQPKSNPVSPEKEIKNRTKAKYRHPQDQAQHSGMEHQTTMIASPPPPPPPSHQTMLNGHSGDKDLKRENGEDERDNARTRDVCSPPLPLPPTPEPSIPSIPSHQAGIKSPPPPSPPTFSPSQCTPNQEEHDRKSISEDATKTNLDGVKSDNDAQKIRYYIIPSPAPSSIPQEAAPKETPNTKGNKIRFILK